MNSQKNKVNLSLEEIEWVCYWFFVLNSWYELGVALRTKFVKKTVVGVA